MCPEISNHPNQEEEGTLCFTGWMAYTGSSLLIRQQRGMKSENNVGSVFFFHVIKFEIN